MNVTAVIAEYNPFHNGHLYQLQSIREHGADYIIIVMSGDFMQRGIPAIVNKYERCRTALLNGADLVFELPVYSALGSAEYFAQGAVSMIDKLGVVDFLHFGSESGDISLLTESAKIAANESDIYKKLLNNYLRQGISFPAARSRALSDIFPDRDIQHIIKTPNNILGMEYIKALIQRNSSIKPVTLTRKGEGYSSSSLVSDSFVSANAIRTACSAKKSSTVKDYMPKSVYKMLDQQLLFTNDFSEAVLCKMLQLSGDKDIFAGYYDVGSQLSHTLHNNLYHYTSFDDFALRNKTKNLTFSRICRCLMHILLDMTQANAERFSQNDYTQYARLLGFSKHGQELLKSIKSNASIPVLTKPSTARKQLADTALMSLQTDIYTALIYESIRSQKIQRLSGYSAKESFQNELTAEIIKLP
ncbi:MAG: nucleotidyltransferase [Lachnospiraceae bacterium]|nr:nucleotidyltransferase [Lachnospiraceae bacterium]